METTRIAIEGMTCAGCVASVRRVLAALPGVHDVNVTLDSGTATVAFDPSRTSVQAMRQAIEDAGYGVAA